MRVKEKASGLMTEGPIGRELIAFAIPLLLGNLFQQFYNTVDSVIVGQFVGSDALAAVGSSTATINLLVGFVMGISIGASVVISKYYGAQDRENVQKAVHSTMAFALIAGVILTVVGIILSPYLLKWMDTPESVMPNSVLYFQIYFAGILFNVIYNMGSGILRAVGDSKRPLYFLIFSSITNILLDLLFVAGFGMGVAGVGIATVIAQGLSALLVLAVLARSRGDYRLELKAIRIHKPILKEIVLIGLPTGIQNSIVSLSNMVVQANINAFGATAVAGCAAYQKLDGYVIMPAVSVGMAMTTFVGQNMGAKNYERMKQGAKVGLWINAGIVIATSVLMYLASPFVFYIFTDDPSVMAYGISMLRYLAPFYFFLAMSHGVAGVMRGAGLTKVPMFIMVGCWCILRVVWISAVLPFWNDIAVVYLGYPITWFASCVAFFYVFFRTDWMHQYDKKQAKKEAGV